MKTYADFYKLYDVLLPAFSKRMNVDDQLRAAARKYIEALIAQRTTVARPLSTRGR